MTEDGFHCHAESCAVVIVFSEPALEVGTANQPVEPQYTALIRLCYCEGMDKQSCPALVACGGRMELHGACGEPVVGEVGGGWPRGRDPRLRWPSRLKAVVRWIRRVDSC